MSYLSDLQSELTGIKEELAELAVKIAAVDELPWSEETQRQWWALSDRQQDLMDEQNRVQADIDEIIDHESAVERRADWADLQRRTL